MESEEAEDGHSQQGHEDPGEVEQRAAAPPLGVSMGDEFDEIGVGLGMAFLAGGDDMLRGEA
jgi:hypothetical protein